MACLPVAGGPRHQPTDLSSIVKSAQCTTLMVSLLTLVIGVRHVFVAARSGGAENHQALYGELAADGGWVAVGPGPDGRS